MSLLQSIGHFFRKEFRRLDWIHDYYFVYFLYKPEKINRYYEYMDSKWGLKVQHTDDYIRITKI